MKKNELFHKYLGELWDTKKLYQRENGDFRSLTTEVETIVDNIHIKGETVELMLGLLNWVFVKIRMISVILMNILSEMDEQDF